LGAIFPPQKQKEPVLIEPNDDLPEELPASSDELIALLNRVYPHRCILPTEGELAAHRYAGARDLIDMLIEWRDETKEAARAAAFEGQS
jgi:hypothetical protein